MRVPSLMVAMALVPACRAADAPRNVVVTPVQLFLAPSTASLQVNATQQFSVTTKLSDGGTAAASADYVATGGTITADGLYTAGSMAGTYRVIATAAGGTLADSSTVAVTATAGRTYTTNFQLTENPISEGGNWLNGATNGLDWTDVVTTGGHAIGDVVADPSHYRDPTAVLTGTWGANQQVTATVYQVNPVYGADTEVELRVRSAISAHLCTGYEVLFRTTVAGDPSGQIDIVRWNGPLDSFTVLASLNGAQYGVQDGDVISVKIVGTTITAYVNGTLMATATDNMFATGAPGIGFYHGPGGGSPANYGMKSFTATDSVQ